jgi:eukaryotic-like serine/threonine-protein kinase
VIYFTSERDGFRCVWAQRLATPAKAPVGPPLPVFHSHDPSLSLRNVGLGPLEISVGRGSLIVTLGERKSNVWMLNVH